MEGHKVGIGQTGETGLFSFTKYIKNVSILLSF